jgi:hypothetical protein
MSDPGGAVPRYPSTNNKGRLTMADNNLDTAPVDAVLALSKLADRDSKIYKTARKYVRGGRDYKGSVTVSVEYHIKTEYPGNDPAVPLNAWAILAAILDTPDGLEIVRDGAERAHHYKDNQDHVKGLAKEAASETWTFTRPASMRVSVKHEDVEVIDLQRFETITVKGGE